MTIHVDKQYPWEYELRQSGVRSDAVRSLVYFHDYKCDSIADNCSYTVVFVDGDAIDAPRTSENVQAYAESLGYRRISTGIIPHVCRVIAENRSDAKKQNLEYVVFFHEPIVPGHGKLKKLSLWKNAYKQEEDAELCLDLIDFDSEFDEGLIFAFATDTIRR